MAEQLRCRGYQPDPYDLTPGQLVHAIKVSDHLERQRQAAAIQAATVGARGTAAALKDALRSLGV